MSLVSKISLLATRIGVEFKALRAESLDLQVLVDFGYQSGGVSDEAKLTVSLSSIKSTSHIYCTPALKATTDHDPDDYWIEGITVFAGNIINGAGFDVIATSENGTFGKYYINVLVRI